MAITFVASQDVGVAAPGAPGGVVPGQGIAIAQTDRIDPRSGGLSIGITFGISIAGHQNQVAQASSQAIDLGVIGTTLAAAGCSNGDKPPGPPTLPADKQPQALQVDSRSPDSAAGKDADETAFPVPIHKHAQANPDPFAKSVTTTSPIGIPQVLQVGSGVATSYSGLIEGGKTREAKAVTDISNITFPGGVSLSGLHWEATWRSTDGGQPQGLFTIGSATGPLGVPIPTNDPTATIKQVNDGLKAIGLRIDPPGSHVAGGVMFVDPMGISVVPNAQRDQIAAGLFAGIQPIRQDLFDALLKADCNAATPITILDIVVGSITGAGAFHLTLGGVQAQSGEVAANPFSLGNGGVKLGTGGINLPAAGGVGVGSAGGTTFKPGTTGGSSTPGTTASAAPAGSGAAGTPTAAIAAAKPKGERGGALAGVGLASLGLLAALAEGDRRKMRRAQREIPQFEE